MRLAFLLLIIFICSDCSTGEKYDVTNYYGTQERDSLMTSIVTYIFTAPPYTSMNDRFKVEHRNYYSALSPRFTLYKYFEGEDGKNYFYVIRPTAKASEKRGVGGYFKMKDHFQLEGFREVFVTPILPEEEVKNRCAFLFDEMVKGDVDKFLTMKSYVQWPNEVSVYDTITYEWRMKESLR